MSLHSVSAHSLSAHPPALAALAALDPHAVSRLRASADTALAATLSCVIAAATAAPSSGRRRARSSDPRLTAIMSSARLRRRLSAAASPAASLGLRHGRPASRSRRAASPSRPRAAPCALCAPFRRSRNLPAPHSSSQKAQRRPLRRPVSTPPPTTQAPPARPRPPSPRSPASSPSPPRPHPPSRPPSPSPPRRPICPPTRPHRATSSPRGLEFVPAAGTIIGDEADAPRCSSSANSARAPSHGFGLRPSWLQMHSPTASPSPPLVAVKMMDRTAYDKHDRKHDRTRVSFATRSRSAPGKHTVSTLTVLP
ncbi:hypothetical protein K439DRAFT_1620504 [Ramaria rubella]|nr:hypothetical protein K439DRAFT_1620504 [Ramaria rubella]